MVDYVRAAGDLWLEWFGEGYSPMGYRSSTYFTEGHVDSNDQLVLGGLASALQRDGLVDSLSDGRAAVALASFTFHGYAGVVDGDLELTICDAHGETFYGDIVENNTPITLVEVIGVAAL